MDRQRLLVTRQAAFDVVTQDQGPSDIDVADREIAPLHPVARIGRHQRLAQRERLALILECAGCVAPIFERQPEIVVRDRQVVRICASAGCSATRSR
jgi:hypothetical protein